MQPLIHVFLLQYVRTPSGVDAGAVLIFFAIIVGFIIVAMIGNRLTRRQGDKTSTRQKYNRFLFDRIGRDIGLSPIHMRYLQQLIKSLRVKYPLLIFTNPTLLDTVLKKGIYAIERQVTLPTPERIKQLNLIYEIKQQIELNSKKGIGLKSTFLVKPGQTLIITAHNGERFHSKVVSNQSASLCITFPVISIEKEQLFRKGNRVKVFFWRENDSGYSFITNIIGFERTQNIPYLHVQHAKKLKREQSRKFSRKPLKKSCFIYPVDVVSEGGKKEMTKKIVTHDSMRHVGIIMDVSVGGCSASSTKAYKKGTYLKLEFDIKAGSPIAVLGKVQSVIRQSSASESTMMHIQYVRISNHSRNQIYSYVYNYI